MRRLRLADRVVALDNNGLPSLLAEAYAAGDRPHCLCSDPGVPMYVARINGRCVLKRMPGTGPQHDPACDSYEPPYSLSGYGQIAAGAIQENVEDGVTLLKLDFSLTRTSRKALPAAGEPTERPSAATDGSKLSLRALLHYLWDQAAFNRWRPGMAGKRNWSVIRKFLLEAAEGKMAKGKPLIDILYLPESFIAEREAEIAQKRAALMGAVAKAEGGKRPLLLLVGEVKEIAPARFGHRMIIRHAPKFPFLLDDDLYRRMARRFASELTLWNAMPESRLIAMAAFGLDAAGVASIEMIALMTTTEAWIPFDHSYDAMLLRELTERRLSFLKALRYNLPADRPLASVILRENGSAPTAMYILPPDADDDFRRAANQLIRESGMASWVWDAGEGQMPPIP